jgi:hypothetical protein
MPIVAVFESPSLTRETYEKSVKMLTNGKGRVESPADWPVPGLLVHAAGQGATGFRVVDVWESEEAFQRFSEKLIPIMEALGIEGQPDVYPVHTLVSA